MCVANIILISYIFYLHNPSQRINVLDRHIGMFYSLCNRRCSFIIVRWAGIYKILVCKFPIPLQLRVQ